MASFDVITWSRVLSCKNPLTTLRLVISSVILMCHVKPRSVNNPSVTEVICSWSHWNLLSSVTQQTSGKFKSPTMMISSSGCSVKENFSKTDNSSNEFIRCLLFEKICFIENVLAASLFSIGSGYVPEKDYPTVSYRLLSTV